MIKKLIFISVTLIIYACATVQSPTGGEKDEKAPILYESKPKDQSINFSGTTIKLFFNEWMKLEQLNKELIITPREEINYEASLKKQELTIELEKPLRDSTTYTFNFRKALKDITEGNLWENPIIAFSTGNYLDSLKVEGTVTQLKNQEVAKSYLVGLYDAHSDTANLRQGKPVYFTTTDEKGNFAMGNIKAGEYLLYTFHDKNNDLVNNSQSESFGYYTDTLNLNDSIPPIDLLTYQRNEDTLKLKKYSPVGKDFIIQYNKGLSKYRFLNPADSNQHVYANDVEDSKYLKVYKENFPDLAYETDSIPLIIIVEDSIANTKVDTAYFKIRESRLTNDNITIDNKPTPKITSGEQELTYTLSKPVTSFNYDSIQLRLDTIPIKYFKQQDIKLSYNRKKIQIHTIINQTEINTLIDSLKSVTDSIQTLTDSIASINDSTQINRKDSATESKNTNRRLLQNRPINNEPNRNITNRALPSSSSSSTTSSYSLNIYLGKGAFIGIESDSTASNTTSLSFKTLENYGIIKGQVIDNEHSFIIELMSENYEVKDTLLNKNDYQFNYVEPGKYRLRLIEDRNANHKWDPGDPLKLTPAENIYYLDEVITVKANWEILDKNFDFSVDKDVDKGGDSDGL
jgi:uncharacterized protein (DUF2141 family)